MSSYAKIFLYLSILVTKNRTLSSSPSANTSENIKFILQMRLKIFYWEDNGKTNKENYSDNDIEATANRYFYSYKYNVFKIKIYGHLRKTYNTRKWLKSRKVAQFKGDWHVLKIEKIPIISDDMRKNKQKLSFWFSAV